MRKVVWEKCIQKREGTVGPDELCAIEKKDAGEENKGDGESLNYTEMPPEGRSCKATSRRECFTSLSHPLRKAGNKRHRI